MTRLPILDRKQMNILSTTTVYVSDPGYLSAEKLLTTSASVNKPSHIHHCSNYPFLVKCGDILWMGRVPFTRPFLAYIQC